MQGTDLEQRASQICHSACNVSTNLPLPSTPKSERILPMDTVMVSWGHHRDDESCPAMSERLDLATSTKGARADAPHGRLPSGHLWWVRLHQLVKIHVPEGFRGWHPRGLGIRTSVFPGAVRRPRWPMIADLHTSWFQSRFGRCKDVLRMENPSKHGPKNP